MASRTKGASARNCPFPNIRNSITPRINIAKIFVQVCLGPTMVASVLRALAPTLAPIQRSCSYNSNILAVHNSQANRIASISSSLKGSLASRSRVRTARASPSCRKGTLKTANGPCRLDSSPVERLMYVASCEAGYRTSQFWSRHSSIEDSMSWAIFIFRLKSSVWLMAFS